MSVSHWAYSEIMEAYADGAVNGTAANLYNPGGNVTMAQIIYSLMAMHQTSGQTLGTLTDQDRQAVKDRIPDLGSVSSSMVEPVAGYYALGLLRGTDSAGSFSPKGYMNRAQTAVIYARLKQVMGTGTGIAPSQTQPETGTSAETSAAALTNGQPVTVENVLALMEEQEWERAGGKGEECRVYVV